MSDRRGKGGERERRKKTEKWQEGRDKRRMEREIQRSISSLL